MSLTEEQKQAVRPKLLNLGHFVKPENPGKFADAFMDALECVVDTIHDDVVKAIHEELREDKAA